MSSQQPRIGLELSTYDMYAPLAASKKTVYATTKIRPDGHVSFGFAVNGEEGSFPGLELDSYFQTAHLIIDNTFIQNYEGTWPVQITITARQDQFEQSQTLTLHDTRVMRADRVEVNLYPSDRVRVPLSDSEVVQVFVQRAFYDANDLELPYDEIADRVELDPPVAGVDLNGIVITVRWDAQADFINVLVTGPDRVAGNTTLTLVR